MAKNQQKPKQKMLNYFKQLLDDMPIFIVDNGIMGQGDTNFRLWFACNNIRYPLQCTGCSKPISKKESKQFDSQCESCWYEICQERSLNEKPLEL